MEPTPLLPSHLSLYLGYPPHYFVLIPAFQGFIYLIELLQPENSKIAIMKSIIEPGHGLISSIQSRYSELNDSMCSAHSIIADGMNSRWSPKSLSWTQLLVASLVAWPLIVAGLRYGREQQRKKRFNFPTRESFAKMTVKDAWKIQLDLMASEVSSIFLLSLKLAIFSVCLYLTLYLPCFAADRHR